MQSITKSKNSFCIQTFLDTTTSTCKTHTPSQYLNMWYDVATLVSSGTSGSSSSRWVDGTTKSILPATPPRVDTSLTVSAAGTTDASSRWLWRGRGRGACLRSTCRPTASGRAWRASSTRRRDPWCWTEPPPPTPRTLSARPSATDIKISSSKYVLCIFCHCKVHPLFCAGYAKRSPGQSDALPAPWHDPLQGGAGGRGGGHPAAAVTPRARVLVSRLQWLVTAALQHCSAFCKLGLLSPWRRQQWAHSTWQHSLTVQADETNKHSSDKLLVRTLYWTTVPFCFED